MNKKKNQVSQLPPEVEAETMGKNRSLPSGCSKRDAQPDGKRKAPPTIPEPTEKRAKVDLPPPPPPSPAPTPSTDARVVETARQAELSVGTVRSDPPRSPREEVAIYKEKVKEALEGKNLRSFDGKSTDIMTADSLYLAHENIRHMGGLVRQVEKLSRHKDVLMSKVKNLESISDKNSTEARQAHDAARLSQDYLNEERVKLASATQEIRELKLAKEQLQLAQERMASDHQREVAELKAKIKEAEGEADEADYVCNSWRAAADMYENVLANLHKEASPTLPARVEELFQGWLATIKNPVREPREVVFILADSYAIGEASSREETATPDTEGKQVDPNPEQPGSDPNVIVLPAP